MVSTFQSLLCAAREGDQQAVGELLEQYRAALELAATANLPTYLNGKLSDSDLVQQTLLDAYRHLSDFQGDSPEMLAAWLRAILANKLRDELRRRKSPAHRMSVLSLDIDSNLQRDLATDSSGPSAKAIRSEEARRLENCLERLPVNYREAIHLRHRDNLSYGEMAQRLSLSENAARKLWVRAIAKLRDMLSE
jgi:RNA polymerase sigma-70 factor (ECF subfamily)